MLTLTPTIPPPTKPTGRMDLVLDGKLIGHLEPTHAMLPGDLMVTLDEFLPASQRWILPIATGSTLDAALRQALVRGMADANKLLEALHDLTNRLDAADVTQALAMESHP